MNRFSTKTHNSNYLKSTRRKLRNNPTPEESMLWERLKERKLEGRKFRRQHSIGRWVVDFYCPAEKIVVELDGARHFTEEGRLNDRERDRYLVEDLNLKIIRFPNSAVTSDIEAVLLTIKELFSFD